MISAGKTLNIAHKRDTLWFQFRGEGEYVDVVERQKTRCKQNIEQPRTASQPLLTSHHHSFALVTSPICLPHACDPDQLRPPRRQLQTQVRAQITHTITYHYSLRARTTDWLGSGHESPKEGGEINLPLHSHLPATSLTFWW